MAVIDALNVAERLTMRMETPLISIPMHTLLREATEGSRVCHEAGSQCYVEESDQKRPGWRINGDGHAAIGFNGVDFLACNKLFVIDCRPLNREWLLQTWLLDPESRF